MRDDATTSELWCNSGLAGCCQRITSSDVLILHHHQSFLNNCSSLLDVGLRLDLSSDPHRIPSLQWSHHFDFHRRWCQRIQLLFIRSQILWNMVMPPDKEQGSLSLFRTVSISNGCLLRSTSSVCYSETSPSQSELLSSGLADLG